MRTCINHGPLPDTNFYPNTSNSECRRCHNARCKNDHARAQERLKELQQRVDEQEAAEALERKLCKPRETWNPPQPERQIVENPFVDKSYGAFGIHSGPRAFKRAWEIR